MKILKNTGIVLVSLLGLAVTAQAQKVQLLHNCASPEAHKVDIYVNGEKVLDDFGFRQYTQFMDMTPGEHTVVVAGMGSQSAEDMVIGTFNMPALTPEDTVYVVAQGVVNPQMHAPNPDGRSTAFQLQVVPNARMMAANANEVDLTILHGTTDAPRVDIREENMETTLVDGVAYTDFASLSVLPMNYKLGVRMSSNNQLLKTYMANLEPWMGKAGLMFASGFADPMMNQNGAPMGLFVAMAEPPNMVNDAMPVPMMGEGGMAKIQILHNCPDMMAEKVDIYVNGQKALDDFAFRQYTKFMDVPAGMPMEVKIAAANSTGPDNMIVYMDTMTLMPNMSYQAVAMGLINEEEYAPNPDGINVSFMLKAIAPAPLMASAPNKVAITVLHGATDAPAVNIREEAMGVNIWENVPYGGSMTNEYMAQDYVFGVRAASNNMLVASYKAEASMMGGMAATVFASGFMWPQANHEGKAFGLFVAMAEPPNMVNDAMPLPTTSPGAKVQIVHNSPDVMAAKVDIYVNGMKVLDDFAFRQYTKFMDMPSGAATITIAAPESQDVNDMAVASYNMLFMSEDTVQLVAMGVMYPENYAPNPEGRSTMFKLWANHSAKIKPMNMWKAHVSALHGSPDAPRVNFREENMAQNLFINMAYGDYMQMEAEPMWAKLGVRLSATEMLAMVFGLDLRQAAGMAGTLVASGFENPAANNNGPALGLYMMMATPPNDVNNMMMVPMLSTQGTAWVQVIHNAADVNAEYVDIYANGSKVMDNFPFRGYTQFMPVPAGEMTLSINGANSASADNEMMLMHKPTLVDGDTIQFIAQGVAMPGMYAPNPDGISTMLKMHVVPGAKLMASNSQKVALTVVHGVTDAPAVKIHEENMNQTLIPMLAYDRHTMLEVPAGEYRLGVWLAASSEPVAAYMADLYGMGGMAGTLLASGFANPAANQNGPGFGLYAAMAKPAGDLNMLMPLPTAPSDVAELNKTNGMTGLYPNPAQNNVAFAYNFTQATDVTIAILDVQGKIVHQTAFTASGTGARELDLTALTGGVYMYRVSTAKDVRNGKLIINR